MFSHKGFTLMELLVVVVIIGILAVVAVPQYQLAVAKSRYATIKNLATSIFQAQEVFYLANGNYAEKLEQLDIDMPAGKLETSTESEYVYPWGSVGFDGKQVVSRVKKGAFQVQYQIVYNHALSSYALRKCISEGAVVSVQEQLCQVETGKKTPQNFAGNTTSGWRAYSYE